MFKRPWPTQQDGRQSVPATIGALPGLADRGGWDRSGFAFDLAADIPSRIRLVSACLPTRPSRALPTVDAMVPHQQGVLRSPTFTLEHRRIHHRLCGSGQVRLVIDGYYMREFHELLFAECSLPDVNSPG